MANSNWRKTPLKDLCTRIGDGLHGTPKYVENSDVFFINGNNLKNGNIVITKDTKTVTDIELENNYIKLDKNTLLLSINGTLGSMAFYNNEKVMLGKSAAYLNFKSDINRFYYYYFQLNGVQEYFYNVATGSTIKNLSLKSIQDFIVSFPEEKEWKPIAKVLSDLDTKIELNNKINYELEAMAKTLYDYWFVQFDFPNEKGKPYKSSGGKMVFNAELKQDIPDGWEVKTISSLFTFQKGTEPGSSEYQNNKETNKHILFHRVGDIYGGSNTYINSSNIDYRIIGESDVIVTFDGSVGKVGFGLNGAYSSGLQKIYDKSGKYNNALVYSLFNDERIIAIIHQYATGSIILHASGSIEHLTIPFKESVYLKFQKIVNPIYSKLVKNKKENQQLTAIRDWLLPMLMNGQITVGEAEEKLSMAAEASVEYKKP
jgi:type I restriction enzyme S subunit